jgi:hypothetical protein
MKGPHKRLSCFHKHHPELYHRGHMAAHVVYLLAAVAEGHGFYSLMGGALLIVTIYGLLVGEPVS